MVRSWNSVVKCYLTYSFFKKSNSRHNLGWDWSISMKNGYFSIHESTKITQIPIITNLEPLEDAFWSWNGQIVGFFEYLTFLYFVIRRNFSPKTPLFNPEICIFWYPIDFYGLINAQRTVFHQYWPISGQDMP